MAIILRIISFCVIKEFSITFHFLKHHSAKLFLLQSPQIQMYLNRLSTNLKSLLCLWLLSSLPWLGLTLALPSSKGLAKVLLVPEAQPDLD